MEEAVTTEPVVTETGQAEAGSEGAQTTPEAPEGTSGQSTAGTTKPGPQDDTFFDPKTVPDELKAAYKQMQGAFTKRMQGISESAEKVQAYDAFMQDPVSQLQQMARQYGFTVTPAGQQAAAESRPESVQPETWDEVYSHAAIVARNKVMEDLKPMLAHIQKSKEAAIESQLDEIDATWRAYEPQMIEELKRNPGLANDPAKLYKISVPDEVLMKRATQIALQKLEAKTKSGGQSGGSTTNKQPAGNLAGDGPRSFAESIEAARKELAAQGLRPPG